MIKYFFKKKIQKKWNKNLLMIFLILGSLITMNSSTWLSAWMGMELNLLCFIPIMKKKNLKNTNSMMIYFIVQASSSTLLLMTIFLIKMEFMLLKLNLMMSMIQISLMMKLGSAPFHWWMPKIMNFLNWKNCFILMTWQKIAPICLMHMTIFSKFIYLSIFYSAFLGSILGINQLSIKLILSYSSINHLAWLLISIKLNFYLFMIYFSIYSLNILSICFILNNLNFSYLSELYNKNNSKITMFMKLILMSLFFSLSGLPPFLGFLPKLFVLIYMMMNSLYMESFIMIIFTLITISYYFNPLMNMIMLIKTNLKFNTNNNYNKLFIVISIYSTLNLIILMPLMWILPLN
uniref:NADH-ubiquinone oxidoreductase chain 2 n=1 Tax=Corynis sp. TaxID=2983160 RepID=A0A977XTL4_9HYME|nr:NADH dehydrogenase subunit 2 [Corynis sp.]